MDIEPPHHPIETKRDFFIHLFTITCGLLIALTLEGLVEWGHHRALVREARENIRQEIADNRKATIEDITNVEQDRARFEHNLEEERDLRAHPKEHHSVQSNFSWSGTDDAAWRTARDTGALAYMPYAEVQRYADVYTQQEIVNNEAVRLFRQQVEAVSPLMMEKESAQISQGEFDRLLHDTATVMIDLRVLGQLATQLRDQYTAALNGH